MTTQRTYWHLQNSRRVPTNYEVATTKLLYHPGKGFEIKVAVHDWYERFLSLSAFAGCDFSTFSDPRSTTYTKYIDLQRSNDTFTSHTFESIDQSDYDKALNPSWVTLLSGIAPPARYLFHGLQMLAAYIGQMAPDSRIAIAASFQAADEMRRIQCLSYRMRQLQKHWPDFGIKSKEIWQTAAEWQAMRKLIEKLLVTYDWSEAFIAINIVAKFYIDRFFHDGLAKAARLQGDSQLSNILSSLGKDCTWHQQWSKALLKVILNDKPDTQDLIYKWIHIWQPLTVKACQGIGEKNGLGFTSESLNDFLKGLSP